MPAAMRLDFEYTRTASAGGMRYATIGSDPLSARKIGVLRAEASFDDIVRVPQRGACPVLRVRGATR
jgi:hypothetical protein